MRFLVCSFLVVGLSGFGSALLFSAPRQPTKPWFCHTLACPTFTVVTTTEEYELRRYPRTTWVTTNTVGMDYDSANYHNFMKLYDYISGQNVADKHITMAVPALDRIIPGPGATCESNFTMYFYIGGDPASVPRPNDPTIKVTTTPPMTVYVRGFSGYYMRGFQKWGQEAIALGAAIGDTTKYDPTYFWTAGYDSPYKLWGRHNEVWFRAKI